LKRALVLVLLASCGGSNDKPVANATATTPSATVDASAPAPPPAATASGVDQSALAGLLAAAAAAATATMQPLGADEVDRGLREAAAKHAGGMTAASEVAKGNLPEGGHLGFIVQLEPGKCYTIVAYGAGVDELDLFLLLPPFYNLLGAHDVLTGATAVIGGAPKMCPISPITVPYKIDMHARKGGGPVAAQVFSKTK